MRDLDIHQPTASLLLGFLLGFAGAGESTFVVLREEWRAVPEFFGAEALFRGEGIQVRVIRDRSEQSVQSNCRRISTVTERNRCDQAYLVAVLRAEVLELRQLLLAGAIAFLPGHEQEERSGGATAQSGGKFLRTPWPVSKQPVDPTTHVAASSTRNAKKAYIRVTLYSASWSGDTHLTSELSHKLNTLGTAETSIPVP